MNKLEKICNEKKQQDRSLQTMNAQNLVSLLQEKETLKKELDKALCEVD
jgi:hypothetical protein